MRYRYPSFIFIVFLLMAPGCQSYITRTVWQSISTIDKPIPPAPDTIKTAFLPNARLAVGWIGHATVLVQIHDKIFLTDPLFTNTIGMIVKRAVEPGIDPSILNKVDFTFISHLHFDHLSYKSLDLLPKNGTLIFPDGLAAYVPGFGFKNVEEMQPWDSLEIDSVRITAVPAQHFNGRYGIDRDWIGDRGYSGYVFEYKGITVFFAGDTGYNSGSFKEIGSRFKIDLAIIPIAPAFGSTLGSYVHVNPRGALEIFKDIKAKYMMPVHFGTMLYGSAANPQTPLNALKADAKEASMGDRIIALGVGEQKILY